MALLHDAGLVADPHEGGRIYYYVTLPQVFEIIDAVGRVMGYGMPHHSQTVLEECSCPACEAVKEMMPQHGSVLRADD